jgi:hypothetical protein
MNKETYYIKHFILQGCGWVQIGPERACESESQAEEKIQEIRARFPQDVTRFETRKVSHTVS